MQLFEWNISEWILCLLADAEPMQHTISIGLSSIGSNPHQIVHWNRLQIKLSTPHLTANWKACRSMIIFILRWNLVGNKPGRQADIRCNELLGKNCRKDSFNDLTKWQLRRPWSHGIRQRSRYPAPGGSRANQGQRTVAQKTIKLSPSSTQYV